MVGKPDAVTSLPAVGAGRAAWLLALPAAGAAVLLLGGRRTDRWVHVLGVAMPVAAFIYGLIALAQMLAYPASGAVGS